MKNRIIYLDLIKIVAAYLVIFTHTSDLGSKLYVCGNYDILQNTIYIGMDVFRTINVPLFFMVTGALLLGKRETYVQLFRKHILKYTLVISVFSYLYYSIYPLTDFVWSDVGGYIKGIYSGTILGGLWFLYAYLGYLLILPFMRKMIERMNIEDYRYLLGLGVFFKCVVPIIDGLIFETGFGVTCAFVTDFIFYPIMGYYFANIDNNEQDNKKYLLVGGICSLISIVFAILMIYWDKNTTGEYSERYLFSFTIIPTLFMFYFLKSLGQKLEKNCILCKIINLFGSCSLGVYLLGRYLQVVMVKPIYRKIDAILPDFPLLTCLIYVAMVVFVAAIITYLLKKIPGIRKLL